MEIQSCSLTRSALAVCESIIRLFNAMAILIPMGAFDLSIESGKNGRKVATPDFRWNRVLLGRFCEAITTTSVTITNQDTKGMIANPPEMSGIDLRRIATAVKKTKQIVSETTAFSCDRSSWTDCMEQTIRDFAVTDRLGI
jgi:hypothetical protein